MHKIITVVILTCILIASSPWTFAAMPAREDRERFYPIYPNFVTNLNDMEETTFISIRVSILTHDKTGPKIIEYYEPLLQDRLLLYFNGKTKEELQSYEGRQRLREQVTQIVKSTLKKEIDEDIVDEVILSHLILE